MPSRDPRQRDDTSVLGQVLEELRALRDDVSHAATKDDLDKLVSKDVFEESRRADARQVTLLQEQVATTARDLNTLKDSFHSYQLQDVRQFGDLRASTTQQLGQVQAGTQQNVAQVKSSISDLLAKSQGYIIGFLGSLCIALLLRALGH